MSNQHTVLDEAGLAMAATPDNAAARLRFYERLADTEMFLLLERESDGDSVEPLMLPQDDGPVVLVFDREARLADFVGKPSAYAAMSGRLVVQMLRGQGVGLGVNLGTPASEVLLPATAVDWLAETLEHRPQETEERPAELEAPGNVPEALLVGLDTKLAAAAGLAPMVYLAAVTYESGRKTHLLAFVDAVDGAEGALATAVGEVLTFSGVEAGELDVAFFAASDPMAARLARVGLRFDLPDAPKPEITEIAPPGMDPDQPPILK
ncbi:type III secretion system (T3SS) SseB-like protein [Aliiruegeria haliotis]|uniref:Type III secretion system (T3SS) SseB-like protein n=1 Tax=Aliiruegeria haliotis TaxID=1280846 RepID=A0A2T0RWT9_9RHOB|nr:SseB family protein [Aliiruegeria haliotis]PRY25592.1 type III secretion system (T3SS) SseB-like protein [Aliiruegeria haliotis]